MGQALSGSSKLIIANTELRQGTIADSSGSNTQAIRDQDLAALIQNSLSDAVNSLPKLGSGRCPDLV